MPHLDMRAFSAIPGIRQLSPMSPMTQAVLQQQAALAPAIAQACPPNRYNTPQLQASCVESAMAAATAGLSAEQLFALVQAKVKCHGFFDALGADVDGGTLAQCVASPDAVIAQLCTGAGSSIPACQTYAPSFVKKYKTPLIIGGGLAVALLILKVVL